MTRRHNLTRGIGSALAAILLVPATLTAQKGGDEIEVWSRDPQGAPTFISGPLGRLHPDAPGESAIALLKRLVITDFGATGEEVLAFERLNEDHLGNLHLRYRQEIFDLPVAGAELIVHADSDGTVFAVTGRFAALRDDLPREPGIGADQAVEIASLEAKITGFKQVEKAVLTYVIGQWDGMPHLAWRTLLQYTSAVGHEIDYLYSDALTGQLVRWDPTIRRAAKNWQTFDLANGGNNDLPGTLLCTDGQSCGGDPIAQATHDNTDLTYDYFDQRFGRQSIDDACLTLRASVHYGNDVVNAAWSRTEEQTWFGDGDTNTGPFGEALDIVAHEWTHGVTFYGPGFNGTGESGALSEGFSDVFAAAVDAWAAGTINANTWTFGEDTGTILRSMADPASLTGIDFYPDVDASGSKHNNAGVLGLAFNLMVEGGFHPRGQSFNFVPAMGMIDAERVSYDALDFLGELSGYPDARNATLLAAAQNWGTFSPQWHSVREAWCAVGVNGLANFGVNNFGYDNTAGGWRVDKHPRFTADVNGDGKDDVVGFGGAGVYVSLSQGGCFGPTQLWINNFGYDSGAGGWRIDKHPRMLADVNGDNKADVVGFGGAGVYVALSTGTSFAPAQLWINNFGYDNAAGGYRVDKHPRMMADVDNDGDDDAIAFGGAGVYVAKSNGNGFGPAQLWINNFGYDNAAGGYRVDKHPRMMANVDGIGGDDVVAFGGAGVYVALSNGTGFGPAQLWVNNFGYDNAAGGYRTDKHPRMMADVDGDGDDDAVAFGGAGVYIARSNGVNGFSPAQLWINDFGYDVGYRIDLHPRMMADVDGDGDSDVVAFGGAGPYLATSTGTAFNPAVLRANNLGQDLTAGGWRTDKHPRMTGDMDGNGHADIVGFGGAGVYLYFN